MDIQKVQIGLRIIRNINDFETGLRKWYQRPRNEHTMDNFKGYFEEARELLEKLHGNGMESSRFNQANAIVDAFRNDMPIPHDNLLQVLVEHQFTSEAPTTPTNVVMPSLNSATSDATQLAILKLPRYYKLLLTRNAMEVNTTHV